MVNNESSTIQRSKSAATGGRWERVTSGAGFGAAITLTVVLAGAVASLYPNAIRGLAAIPTDQAGAWTAWWFIGLVFLALVLVIVNQSSIYKRSGREQQTLNSTLDSLENQQVAFHASLDKLNGAVQRLNTLPSQSFLPAFRDSYREAFDLTLGCIAKDAGKADTEVAIRAVLGAIIETAKDFDGAAQECVYGANVMLFRDRAEPPLISDSLGLVAVTASHAEYAGVLELIPELSTSSVTVTAGRWDPDGTTVPIALPIPTSSDDYFDQQTGRTKSVVLPGAPTSFIKRSFDAYPTMDVFVEALRESALQDVWVGRIMNYFASSDGNGHHIRSFASLPIERTPPQRRSPGGSASARAADLALSGPASTYPVAVLNLHSVRPGLLADNGGSLFAPLMGPFSSLLAILIIQWRTQRASTGAKGSTEPDTRGDPQKGMGHESSGT